jgi:hypothetical protein
LVIDIQTDIQTISGKYLMLFILMKKEIQILIGKIIVMNVLSSIHDELVTVEHGNGMKIH